MTAPSAITGSACALNQAQVADYLRTHHEFFNHHPELLQSLVIPHDSGQAVSLWERQTLALREENTRLLAKFDELVDSARDNVALIGRIHRLALALMEAVGLQAIFNLLMQQLADDFRAERVTVLVFARPAYVESPDFPQFVGRESPRREPFAEMLEAGIAVCGRLSLAQTHALFDGEDFRGSHVMLPLAAAHWDGLIAVSSADTERFDAKLGTEFLAFLRDVIALVVAPWIAKPRP